MKTRAETEGGIEYNAVNLSLIALVILAAVTSILGVFTK